MRVCVECGTPWPISISSFKLKMQVLQVDFSVCIHVKLSKKQNTGHAGKGVQSGLDHSMVYIVGTLGTFFLCTVYFLHVCAGPANSSKEEDAAGLCAAVFVKHSQLSCFVSV